MDLVVTGNHLALIVVQQRSAEDLAGYIGFNRDCATNNPDTVPAGLLTEELLY